MMADTHAVQLRCHSIWMHLI